MPDKQPQPKKKRSGSDKRQRDCFIKFRAKLQERAEIKASARAAGLSVGSFLRSLALAAPRTRPVRDIEPTAAHVLQFLGQVGHYTGNLRQLVKRANAYLGDKPEVTELAEIAREAREFLDLARILLKGA